MKKILLFVIVIIFLSLEFFNLPKEVFAAKTRIRTPSGKKTVVTSGSYSSASIYPSRLGMVVNLFNLDKVSKVSYVLSYTGSAKSQGVVGSFVPGAATDARELLFGTCSRGACVYHENVTNARLTINFTLKAGGIFTKRYLLKVRK